VLYVAGAVHIKYVPLARRAPLCFFGLFGVVGDGAARSFTWVLEVLPAVAVSHCLAITRRPLPFTGLAYTLMFVHALILLVGGHYTYAEVPLFNWLRDTLGLARNYYDRVGHLAQGFIPAIIAREILLRTSPLRLGGGVFCPRDVRVPRDQPPSMS